MWNKYGEECINRANEIDVLSSETLSKFHELISTIDDADLEELKLIDAPSLRKIIHYPKDVSLSRMLRFGDLLSKYDSNLATYISDVKNHVRDFNEFYSSAKDTIHRILFNELQHYERAAIHLNDDKLILKVAINPNKIRLGDIGKALIMISEVLKRKES